MGLLQVAASVVSPRRLRSLGIVSHVHTDEEFCPPRCCVLVFDFGSRCLKDLSLSKDRSRFCRVGRERYIRQARPAVVIMWVEFQGATQGGPEEPLRLTNLDPTLSVLLEAPGSLRRYGMPVDLLSERALF